MRLSVVLMRMQQAPARSAAAAAAQPTAGIAAVLTVYTLPPPAKRVMVPLSPFLAAQLVTSLALGKRWLAPSGSPRVALLASQTAATGSGTAGERTKRERQWLWAWAGTAGGWIGALQRHKLGALRCRGRLGGAELRPLGSLTGLLAGGAARAGSGRGRQEGRREGLLLPPAAVAACSTLPPALPHSHTKLAPKAGE